jgi:hypothetical protein
VLQCGVYIMSIVSSCTSPEIKLSTPFSVVTLAPVVIHNFLVGCCHCQGHVCPVFHSAFVCTFVLIVVFVRIVFIVSVVVIFGRISINILI